MLFLKDSPGDSIVQPGLRFPSTWPKQEGGRENSDRIGGLVAWWEMRGKGELIWMVVGRCCPCRDDQWGVAGAQRSQGLLAKESLAFNFRLFAALHYNTTLEFQILSESLYMPNLVSTVLWQKCWNLGCPGDGQRKSNTCRRCKWEPGLKIQPE